MRLVYRLLIAIPMAFIYIAVDYYLYQFGFFMGGMMTDSCSNMPGYLFYWLEFIWPAVMLIGALVPPILVLCKVRWKYVILAMVSAMVLGVVVYLAWLPLLQAFC